MDIKGCSPEVSVIVVTYNQELNKLIKTLESVVRQKDISFEIIVCDDGSKKRFENELHRYFSMKAFPHYKLVFHNQNKGTVSNYYSGLVIARGTYSKLLGPGDYLSEEYALKKWIHFLKNSGAKWSFSNTYFYRSICGIEKFICAKARPQVISPYTRGEKNKSRWNYVVLRDTANGASLIGLTDLQKKYCKKIMNKGIKYCEDHIYQLMMFHGCVGAYYSETAVCYEVGSGISTSGILEWQRKMLKDRQKLIQLMNDEKEGSFLKKKMVMGILRNSKPNKFSKIFIRGKLSLWMRQCFFPRRSDIPKEVEI